MPPKNFKSLTEEQLKFIDHIINLKYPEAAESTKKINANCVKKVFEICKLDPCAPITLSDNEMVEKFTEAIHKVHQPTEAFIQQNAKRIVEYCHFVKAVADEQSKPVERKEFEEWIKSPEGYAHWLENRDNIKRKRSDVSDDVEDSDADETEGEETDNEETQRIEAAEVHKLKKRK